MVFPAEVLTVAAELVAEFGPRFLRLGERGGMTYFSFSFPDGLPMGFPIVYTYEKGKRSEEIMGEAALDLVCSFIGLPPHPQQTSCHRPETAWTYRPDRNGRRSAANKFARGWRSSHRGDSPASFTFSTCPSRCAGPGIMHRSTFSPWNRTWFRLSPH